MRLVRDAVEIEPLEALSLKGKSAPVAAFRLLAVDPLAPGLARRFDVPPGRAGARAAPTARSVGSRGRRGGLSSLHLLGAAGVGKSRLVAELLSDVGDEARVLAGRCLPYGDGITFWPLVEALSLAGKPAAAGARASEKLAARRRREELFLEVRRLARVTRRASGR